mgnify:CR=1 FL=1
MFGRQANPQLSRPVTIEAVPALFGSPDRPNDNVDVLFDKLTPEQQALIPTFESRADEMAAKGAIGQGLIKVQGLENLLATVQERLKNPELAPEEKTKLEEAAARLMVLQVVGKSSTNEQGEPVRLYDFELTPDGHFLLNGSDLSATGQQKEQAPGAAQPQTP